MPRRSKGARLHLRPARYRAGKLTHQATWIIRDGAGYYATGYAEREVAAAEQLHKDYIAKKYAPTRKEQDLEKIPIADVLSIFIDDRPDLYVENSDAQKYLNRIGRLKEFWGKLMLSEVTRTKCREYQQHRGNKGGARRDLEDLRARRCRSHLACWPTSGAGKNAKSSHVTLSSSTAKVDLPSR